MTFETGYRQGKESIISYTYDAKHRLVKQSAEERLAAYSVTGERHENTTLLRATVTEYTYDALDRCIQKESYLLGTERTEGKTVEKTVYDENGRVKESYIYNSLDPASKLYTFTEYDDRGRVSAELDATGKHKTALTYAPDGSLRAKLLPNGAAIAYGSSPDGNCTSVTASTKEGEENTNRTHYTAGVVTKLESGGNTVEYTYDGKRRVTSVSLNGETYISRTYDDDCDGGLTVISTMTYANDPNAFMLQEGYDFKKFSHGSNELWCGFYAVDGRITLRTPEVYQYDTERRLSLVTDDKLNPGTQESYSYDEEGRVLSYTVTPKDKTDATVYTYTYDTATGKLLNISESDELSISPKQDKLGRNAGKTVTTSSSKVIDESISYVKFADRATMLPASVSYTNASGKGTLSYVYDNMGNICEIRENGKLKARYAYDALGRLTREDNKDFAKTEVFTYDNRGNILSRREYPFSLKSANELEELTLVGEKLYTYEGDKMTAFNGEACVYDAIGNPTTYRGKAVTWQRARLLSTFDGVSFTYDKLGRCTDMGANVLIYDHNDNLVEANGLRVIRDHTGLLGVRDASEAFYCFQKDVQGNILALLDSQGNVMVKYVYDSWGKCKVLDANGNEIADATHIGNRNPFRYRGYYLDTNTGLYYLKSRFYDPETGRFLNADTIDYLEPDTVNGLNLYAYCGNNPVMYSDPSGHSFFLALLVSVIIGAAIGGTLGGINAINAGQQGWGVVGAVLGGAIMGGAIGAISAIGGAAGLASIGINVAGYSLSTMAAFSMSALIGAGAGIASYATVSLSRNDVKTSLAGFVEAGVSGMLKGITTFGIAFWGGRAGAFDKMVLKEISKGTPFVNKMETYYFAKALLADALNVKSRIIFTKMALNMGDMITKLFFVSSISAGSRWIIDQLFNT